MLIIGHRGACGHAPENTLASVRKAIDLGVAAFEIDVRYAGGEVWCFHDRSFERTTDGVGLFDGASEDQIRSVNAGDGERIPTLFELTVVVDRKARLIVELKGPGVAGPTAAILADAMNYGAKPTDFMVCSFDHRQLEEFQQADTGIAIAASYWGVPSDLTASAERLGAQAAIISADFCPPELVKDAKERGLDVYVFTVNDPTERPALRDMGVDGLITGFPDLF